MNQMRTEPVSKKNVFRGTGWLLVALLGAAALYSDKLTALGINEYTARWLGVCFKAASGAWGGYRVSRDVLKIDPSLSNPGSPVFGMLHLARAILVGAVILAITQGT